MFSHLGETMNATNRLNTCFVCGHRVLASEGFPLENPRVLRHRKCSKQGLVLELGKRAGALGLTSLELLTRRLEGLQSHVVQALGELSFEQFQSTEPAGYLHMFLSDSDLRVRIEFSRRIHVEAIYREALITPGELYLHKTRLLLQIKEQAPTRPGSTQTGPSGPLLTDWFIVADWLKQAEEHWTGRKKEEIAREILATERVQFNILGANGMDRELASRPLEPHCSKLEPIAQQILSAEDPDSSRLVETIRADPMEVV